MGFHKNFFFSSKEISERSFIAFKAGSSGFYYDFLFLCCCYFLLLASTGFSFIVSIFFFYFLSTRRGRTIKEKRVIEPPIEVGTGYAFTAHRFVALHPFFRVIDR